MPSDGGDAPFVVGIGASAGGLEALERLLDNMPERCPGVAFVVVQHLSPDHKSLMVDLLAKRTRMAVVQAADGMAVEAGTFYVLPPGKTITIDGLVLHLADKESRRGVALPIDAFLVSLAADRGAGAAAVVLSGTGSDGTQGVRAIHEHGGLVIAQDPATARFDGMPRSAIATGVVDEILPPERIMGQVLAYLDRAANLDRNGDVPQAVSGVGLDVEGVERIIRVLFAQTGMDFSRYRRTTLTRRIRRRMQLSDVTNVADYAVVLAANAQEAAALKRELLISVTAFFRDREAFDELATGPIPALVREAGAGGQIRAWVCGCATGEEAYSLAILFSEAMAAAGSEAEVKIFATDIDRHALDQAGTAEYPASLLAEMDPILRERYFQVKGEGYKVVPALRRMITFASHNVIKDPPFTRLDFISCRNLLIYFEPDLQQAVLSRLQFALKVGGRIFLGSSETLGPINRYFQPEGIHAKVYRLVSPAPLPLADIADLTQSRTVPGPRAARPSGGGSGRYPQSPAVGDGLHHLVQTFCPPAVLLNEALEIVQNFGGAERYLRMPQGAMTLDVSRHLPPGVGGLVSSGVHRAFRDWADVRIEQVMLDIGSGAVEPVTLAVSPVPASQGYGRHALLVFQPAAHPQAGEAAGVLRLDSSAQERIHSLEEEIRRSREDQQATVEELETTNEELQASNEELLASNEELQSTNEELQSVNEELYTVNAELSRKIEELTRLTDDLDNLMRATAIATIFLDEESRVRRFTPEATLAVNLIDADIGRRITDLSIRLDYPELFSDIARVQAEGCLIEREVSGPAGVVVLTRIRPYHGDHSRLSGVVLTFTEVTEVKEAQRRLQVYFDSLGHEVCVVDASGRIVLVNAAWNRFALDNDGDPRRCGVGMDYLQVCQGMPGAAVGPAARIAASVSEGLRAVLDGRLSFFTHEYPCHSATTERWFLLTAAPVRTGIGGAVITHVDITERKQDENRLRMAATVFQNSGEAIMITDADQVILSINPAFTAATGYLPEDVVGLTPRVLASGRHDRSFYRVMFDELAAKGVWRGEIWNKRRSGQIYPEWLAISAVTDGAGTVTHYVAVFTDITQQKEAETRLRSINTELEQFAYVASHDLREPLRMVTSYLDLIARRLPADIPRAEEMQEFITYARDGAQRMDRLILDLLDYSRVGRQVGERVPVPLGGILDLALSNLRPAVEDAGAVLERDVEPEAAALALPEDELTRVVQNLVGNSLKYRNPGRPCRIRVVARATGGTLELGVSDNGIGIPPDQHARVFRVFQRLHPRDAYGGGTGIGLSICQKIVDRRKGHIRIESVVGEGTTFWVTLPLTPDGFLLPPES